MITLKVTHKTLKTSMEIMVMELEKKKGEVFWSFVKLWIWERREYTVREEGNSRYHF